MSVLTTEALTTEALTTEALTSAEEHCTARPTPGGPLPCHTVDADLWFAESPADVEAAKALCAPCPLRRHSRYNAGAVIAQKMCQAQAAHTQLACKLNG